MKNKVKKKEICDHVIGHIAHYSICSGRDSVFVYKSDPSFKEDEDFMAFEYCPNCGKKNG